MSFSAEDLRGLPMQRIMHARLAQGGYLWTRKSIDFPELTTTTIVERRGEPARRTIFVGGDKAESLQHAAELLYVARHRPFDADEPVLEEAES